jgi:hypothetical protein
LHPPGRVFLARLSNWTVSYSGEDVS